MNYHYDSLLRFIESTEKNAIDVHKEFSYLSFIYYISYIFPRILIEDILWITVIYIKEH